jgi:uncharacterized protein (TIGR03437 family)
MGKRMIGLTSSADRVRQLTVPLNTHAASRVSFSPAKYVQVNKFVLVTAPLLLAIASTAVHAQPAPRLWSGSGFALTDLGGITTNPSEVVSGAASIRGSYGGKSSYNIFLRNDASVLVFKPANTYRVTFKYRILATPDQGFDVLFYSPTAGAAGNYLPTARITGNVGDSSTQTLTSKLGQFSDYQLLWEVVGVGAISIDDIQVIDMATGQTLAAENAEFLISDPGPQSVILEANPPSTLLAPGATGLTLSLRTSTSTVCRYSTGADPRSATFRPFDAGAGTADHKTSINGLSPDPRTLTNVYVRCDSNPGLVVQLQYRSVATVSARFPHPGALWVPPPGSVANSDQASRFQIYMGADWGLPEMARIRGRNPNALFLISTSLDEASDEYATAYGIPHSYFLKDVNGKRIEGGWALLYKYNLTKPEVADFLADLTYKRLLDLHLEADGFFFDNVHATITNNLKFDVYGNPVHIDANGDGIEDDPVWLDAAWSAGLYRVLDRVRSRLPNGYVAGHVWDTSDTKLKSYFNGQSIVASAVNVREGLQTFSSYYDSYQSWFGGVRQPAVTMIESAPPTQIAYGYGSWNVANAIPPATFEFGRTFFPNMRFGLTTALMNDGFFFHDFGDVHTVMGDTKTIWWYEEYDFDLGFPISSARRVTLPGPGNLLSNPGFETSVEGSWQLLINNTANAAARVERDATISAEGSWSGHVTVTSTGAANWHVNLRQVNLSLTAGTAYRAQFWARASGSRPMVACVQGGAPDYAINGLYTQFSLDTTWRPYEVSIIAKKTISDASFQFFLADAAGEVWIDAVRLWAVPQEIYRRDFTHGTVLLNSAAKTATVALEPGFVHFTGQQAPRVQYLVDDTEELFGAQGSWRTATIDSGYDPGRPKPAGPYYHAWNRTCHVSDDGSGTAQWALTPPKDGEYTIQAWWAAAPEIANWSKSAVYEVVAGGQVVASATLDQSSGGDQWHTVAKVQLDAASAPILRLRSTGKGPLIADGLHVFSTARLNDGSATNEVQIMPMDGVLLKRQEPLTDSPAHISSIVNGGSFTAAIASAGWVTLFGSGIGASARSWVQADFDSDRLPTSLDGVSVTINGLPAYLSYVSPTQINALAPDDPAIGEVPFEVHSSQGILYSGTVLKQKSAPAFFSFISGGKTYASAVHADGSYVTPDNPARTGELIVLFGTGFGGTNPSVPTSRLVSQGAPLAQPAEISIGGANAGVQFGGLVAPGLYQFNVKIPGIAAGDQPVFAAIGGFETPPGPLLPVRTN